MLQTSRAATGLKAIEEFKFYPSRGIQMLSQPATVTQMDKAPEPSTPQKDALLRRAVIKVVASGESADEMIELLKSGLTVGELLEYLAAAR